MPSTEMEIYPVPDDLRQCRLRLEARTDGGGWREVPLAFASSIDERPHANGGCEGWAGLSSDQPVEFRVTLPDPVTTALIRPSLRNPVPCERRGRQVHFRLQSPRYLALEVNQLPSDDRWSGSYTLYLFLDPVDRDTPAPGDPGVRTLPPGHHQPGDFNPGDAHTLSLLPGTHTVEGQMVELYDGKTLHLVGGAYLRSYIRGVEVSRATIRGRGVIDGTGVDRKSTEWRDDGDAGFVFLRRGEGNLIDGPVIYDSPFWNIVTFGTRGTVIRNHKCVTWKVNNDGFQPRSCSDLLVENCFLKCADDCLAVKTRRAAAMEARNLVFRGLTLWNDAPGNPMEIGHTSQADILEDVRFQDIAVIHAAREGHTISVCLIDHCEVRGVRYEDIRVEGPKVKDFGLRITTSRYSTDAERGRIKNITIHGYSSDGPPQGGEITGFDQEHQIEGLRFENLVFRAADPDFRQTIEELSELKLSVANAAGIVLSSGEVPAPPAPDRVVEYKTVESDSLKLHLFEPPPIARNGGPVPAVVFFFGGGWVTGNPTQFFHHCQHFASRGMLAISAEYRVAKRHGTDPFAAVRDGKSAIRYLRSHAGELGLLPNRIIAGGGSAGGHVAACAGLVDGHEEEGEDVGFSSVPDALILFNPVVDTTDQGFGADTLRGRNTEISPVHHIRPGLPPCLIFHGTADTTSPFENVQRFKILMDKTGNLCELVPFEGGEHGFFNYGRDGGGAYWRTIGKADEFLERIGFLAASPTLNPILQRESANLK